MKKYENIVNFVNKKNNIIKIDEFEDTISAINSLYKICT
jgi:Fe-S-cluster formation regulator IscX/YfhJ